MKCKGVTKKGRLCNNSCDSNYCKHHSFQYIKELNIGKFGDLPIEIFRNEIFTKLDYSDKLRLSMTSKDIKLCFSEEMRKIESFPEVMWQLVLRDINICKQIAGYNVFGYISVSYVFPWCTLSIISNNLKMYKVSVHFSSTGKIIKYNSMLNKSMEDFKKDFDEYFLNKILKSKELLKHSLLESTYITWSTNQRRIYEYLETIDYPKWFNKVTKNISALTD